MKRLKISSPKDFFDVKAHIVTPQEERFVATWVPSEACEP